MIAGSIKPGPVNGGAEKNCNYSAKHVTAQIKILSADYADFTD
jgi:hypothetical protein